MYRLIVIICCLGLTLNLCGQSRKGKRVKKPQYFLKIEGGYLADRHQRADYNGFNMIGVGWTYFGRNSFNEFSLEVIGYQTESQRPNNSHVAWKRKRKSFELAYFKSLYHLGNIKNGVFLGPTASVMKIDNYFGPNNLWEAKYEEKSFHLGLGAKALYSLRLSKVTHLLVSTKLTLVDFKFKETQDYEPLILLSQQHTNDFLIDWLRTQYQVMVEFGFRLL